MIKRIFAGVLCLLLLQTLHVAAFAQEEPLILEKQDYKAYPDVSQEDWFYEYAKLCQETQLIIGQKGVFQGGQVLSKEEAIAIIVRLRQAYWGDPILQAVEGDDWFSPYLRYALEHNFLTEDEYRDADGNERIFFLSLLTDNISESNLIPINEVYDIPDFDTTTSLGQAILAFYKFGVLTGTDSFGSLAPNRPITRAEAAAIISRLIRADLRVQFSPEPIPGQDAWKALVRKVNLEPHPDDRLWFDGTYLYSSNTVQEITKVMDDTGKLLFSLDGQYHGIEDAGDGIFKALRSEYPTVQYLTKQGAPLNDQLYENGTNFENGTALVYRGEETPAVQLIDTSGAVVRSFDINEASATQLVDDVGIFPYLSTNEIGLLSVKTGAFLRKPYTTTVPPQFTEGLIGVEACPGGWGGPYGFMNTQGELVLPMKYYDVLPFQNGYASICRIEDEKATYALIDKKGTEILSSDMWIYDSPNSNGLLLASDVVEEDESTRTVLMNLDGEFLLDLPENDPSIFALYDSYIVRYSTTNLTPSGIFTLDGEDALLGVRIEEVFPYPQRCLLKIQGNYYFYEATATESKSGN